MSQSVLLCADPVALGVIMGLAVAFGAVEHAVSATLVWQWSEMNRCITEDS